MMRLPDSARRRLETEGYREIPDSVLAQIEPWLRLAPGVSLVWTAAGVLLQSPWVLFGLVPFCLMGAITRGHPFDVFYNRGVRRRTGAPTLPPYPAPRRFAFLVSAVWVLALAIGYTIGGGGWVDVLGAFLVLLRLVHLTTGYCVASHLHCRIFGPSEPYRS
ncbi:MAG: DUF4395 family protein [Candidatus Eisenbacteria bacterium]|uniref:DUF4395 family protein n=1 Tax=Eiseniibacteriota bacterium TaxID=2212470 RepID=A0A956M0T6_UNCEI|nr:DUF4395 family protein [Candidatus Eisenbacteria bacterium]